MSVASAMLSPVISKASRKSIFSRVSAAGPTLFDWLDGPSRGRSSLEVARASLLARLEKAKCAASAGAPHIRQRLFFVSDTRSERFEQGSRGLPQADSAQLHGQEFSADGKLCDPPDAKSGRLGIDGSPPRKPGHPDECCATGTILDADGSGCGEQRRTIPMETQQPSLECSSAWSDFDVLNFRDGKARRVEAGTFPLAHGVPGRVGRLRGYGNAIVPQVAAEFIKAYLEAEVECQPT